jgi:hypothetical protein
MTQCSLLERTLAENLSWNAARIKFLARFLLALFAAKTVNLAHIAIFFGGRAKEDSNYKRIQRFLRFFEISEADLARLVVRLMKLEPPFVITIDRTEWQLGKRWVNVLMLALADKGVAVPILWLVFEKKGCSDDVERKQILEKYLSIFASTSIGFVTADREFASKRWLKFLTERKIPFCLRIKANTPITDKRGRKMAARQVVRTLKIGEVVKCRRKRRVWGIEVLLAGRRKANKDHVIVIASASLKGQLMAHYRLRWEIETLFGCLKTRGFRLEDTHLTKQERVSRLLGLLVLAFCWAFLSGELVMRKKPLKRKKHGRLEKSVFRAGLDYLRRHLCRPTENGQKQESRRLILLLSCT